MFAARPLSNSARAHFLQLPASIRTQVYQQYGISRSFSVSAPQQDSTLLGIAIAPPMTLLNTFHDLGIPWYAAIPATAVVVRGVVGYYLGSKPAHKRANIRTKLVPLVSADLLAENKLLSRTRERSTKKEVDSSSLGEVMHRLRRVHKTGKQFGAPLFTWSGILNFGALIATTEAIRLKVGANDGLLKILLHPFEAFVAALQPKSNASSSSVDPVESLPALPEVADPSYFDPSMCVEGLSWCPNLSVQDPLLILPLSLLAVTFLSMIFRPGRAFGNGAYSFVQSFTTADFWMFALVVMVVEFGYHMPAGIFLYFLSSTVVARVQQIWLNVRQPIATPVTPCKMPPRRRVVSGLDGI